MTGNSRRVLKSLTDQINKSSLLYNASTAIGNATERAQEKFSNIQNVASEKYTSIIKVYISKFVFEIFLSRFFFSIGLILQEIFTSTVDMMKLFYFS